MFISVITFVAIMFCLLLPGFILRKVNLLKREAASGLSALLLYVCSPLLIFKSLFYSKESNIDPTSPSFLYAVALVSVVSFVVIFVVFFVAKLLLFKCQNMPAARAYTFASVFGNVAFIGIPFIQYILKDSPLLDSTLVYASVFNIVFNVLCWTLGVYIITGSFKALNAKKILLNPIILVSAIALPLYFLKIDLPLLFAPAADVISFLGAMTTPLSMIIVGIRLVDVRIKDIFSNGWVYLGSMARLFIAPLLAFAVVMLLKALGVFGAAASEFYLQYGKSIAMVVFALSALPCAASTIAFCERFDGDSIAAVRVFMNSTFLSLITMPIMITFMFSFL